MQVVIGLALLSSGCRWLAPPPPPPPMDVTVRVVGDPEEPLADVAVQAGSVVATTGRDGRATLALAGPDGTKVDLAVTCPPGFAPPSRATRVTIARTSHAPEYELACRHVDRGLLVAIRTTNAANVPIVYLEREIARTDDAGYALVRLEPKAGETLTFTLDTSSPRFKMLRPQRPELSLPTPEGDDAIAVEQKFTIERPRAVAAPKPNVPRRLE